MKRLLVALISILGCACAIPVAADPLDDVLVRRDAVEVKKLTLQDSGARQISYVATVNYPESALNDADYARLKSLGWSKCVASRSEGWQSFVDEAAGKDKQRMVFQKATFWHKADGFLTISFVYYSSPAKRGQDGRYPDAPDNARQNVIIQVRDNVDLRGSPGIDCP